MTLDHLIRDAEFSLRDRIQPLEHRFEHQTAVAANPLAFTGLHGGFHPILWLEHYLDRNIAQENVPAAVAPADLPAGFQWGMLLNDQLGDCVPAEILHSIEAFHIGAGTTPPPFADQDAQTLYSAVGGYVPGQSSTDQGTDPGTAWNYWMNTGITCAADKSVHKIAGLVGFNPTDELMRHVAIYEFSCAQYAIGLPLSWQGATSWTGLPNSAQPNTAAGSWGGHGICARAYDAQGVEDIITWGADLLADGDSLSAYLQEAAAVVSVDQLTSTGVSHTGISWGDLVSDLTSQIQQQQPIT